MYELMVSPEVAGYILAVKEKLHHTTATETVAFLLDIRFNQLDTDLLPLTPVATTQRLRVYLRERHSASLKALNCLLWSSGTGRDSTYASNISFQLTA